MAEQEMKYNLKQIDPIEIEQIEIVGRGSYGTVSKAKWNNKTVAVKKFDSLSDNTESIEREIKQLSRVEHPNIISLYGICFKDTSISLIMEYAEGGSLYNFLHGKTQPKYEIPHALSWTCQCAEGVAYMHQIQPKGLIHRDLKTPNLLLFNKGRFLKICDFGTVADKKTHMTNNKGSAIWMAPEVFEKTEYSEKCDVFSWGIILWEVLTGKVPYGDLEDPFPIMWRVHEGDRPSNIYNCPIPIQKLMRACWDSNPDKRPSMENVVKLMKQFCEFFPGADKPIDYNSRRSQESTDKEENCTNNDKLSTFDNSEHNYENLKNIRNIKSPSTSIMKGKNNFNQSIINGIFNNSYEAEIRRLNTFASNFNIYDTITECKEESLSPSVTPNTNPTSSTNVLCYNRQTSNAIHYLPNIKTLTRNEASNCTLRNGSVISQHNPFTSLEIEVDPNAWELKQDDYDKIMKSLSRSDGTEHLTVTETKSLNNRNDDCTINSSNNFSDGLEQSYYLMLDPELQPEQPYPNSPLSQKIFEEHNMLAKEFLQVEEKLYYANDDKEKILASLSNEEKQRKNELIQKIVEKDSLLEFYNKLRQELDEINNEQKLNSENQLIEHHSRHQQQLSSTSSLQQNQINSSFSDNHSDSNDESWVKI